MDIRKDTPVELSSEDGKNSNTEEDRQDSNRCSEDLETPATSKKQRTEPGVYGPIATHSDHSTGKAHAQSAKLLQNVEFLFQLQAKVVFTRLHWKQEKNKIT